MTLLVSIFTPMSFRRLHLAVDDVAGQAEGGDAVAEHAAHHVERLVDGHVGAVAHQVGGGGEAGRAGAHHGHLAELPARRPAGTAWGGLALSPTKRSSRPMATDSTFLLMMHCASHCDSCGQTRPQIDGNMLAS